MTIDRSKSEPNIEPDKLGDEKRTERSRELFLEFESARRRALHERLARDRASRKPSGMTTSREGASTVVLASSSTDRLRPLELSSSEVDLGALNVELGYLRAQVLRARRVENQLRSQLATQVASHDAQLSKLHGEAGQYQAEISRYQAEVSRYQAEVSRYQVEVSRYQAEVSTYQAENADLRRKNDVLNESLTDAQRENDAINELLTEARLKLGDDELEICMLRRRLGLEQRPSPSDVN